MPSLFHFPKSFCLILSVCYMLPSITILDKIRYFLCPLNNLNTTIQSLASLLIVNSILSLCSASNLRTLCRFSQRIGIELQGKNESQWGRSFHLYHISQFDHFLVAVPNIQPSQDRICRIGKRTSWGGRSRVCQLTIKEHGSQAWMAYACHPSYSGGRDHEDHGSKPPRQIVHKTLSQKYLTHKELVEWLKV
jgi:hypothetical protein